MASEQPAAARQAGRYVVLRHHGQVDRPQAVPRGEHYDWMFQLQGELLTWASTEVLSCEHAGAVDAIALAPHRLIYLDYQGAVSGNRGTVDRIEAGHHRLVAAAADRYEFAVQGQRCGQLRIYRTWPGSPESWLIEFEPSRGRRPLRSEAS